MPKSQLVTGAESLAVGRGLRTYIDDGAILEADDLRFAAREAPALHLAAPDTPGRPPPHSRHAPGSEFDHRPALVMRAAVQIALDDTDKELMWALLDVHKSIEAERSALAHGHFGLFDKVPDVILWTTANDYVQLKARLHLANAVLTPELLNDLVSRISYYRKDDLTKIYNDILYCASMRPAAINWLRSHGPPRDQLYRQLCDEPRIAQALIELRQKNKTSTPPQPTPPTPIETRRNYRARQPREPGRDLT